MSQLSEKFAAGWEEHGFSGSDMTPEYRFHPVRRWRFDFAWPSCRVAVELHGYGYGHLTVAQVSKDAEKLRAAVECGWHVIPFTSACVNTKAKLADAVEQVCRVLSARHMERLEELREP